MKRTVTPDEVALEDPKDQPPDYGPPMDDDMAYEPIPVSGEQQYFDPDDEDMNPPGDGPGGNPDDHQASGTTSDRFRSWSESVRKSRCSFGATRISIERSGRGNAGDYE